MYAENEAELRDQDPDADAFRAGTHRKPDDRQEQNVEQLELLLLREAEDQRKRQRDRDELQQVSVVIGSMRRRVIANSANGATTITPITSPIQ